MPSEKLLLVGTKSTKARSVCPFRQPPAAPSGTWWGGAMTSFTYQGDIVLACYAGEFRLESSAEAVKLGELD